MTLTLKFRLLQRLGEEEQEHPISKSSGRTNLIHFTKTSRQVGALWAGIVIILIPLWHSIPCLSTSFNITAIAIRFPGHIFFKLIFNCKIRPKDSK